MFCESVWKLCIITERRLALPEAVDERGVSAPPLAPALAPADAAPGTRRRRRPCLRLPVLPLRCRRTRCCNKFSLSTFIQSTSETGFKEIIIKTGYNQGFADLRVAIKNKRSSQI